MMVRVTWNNVYKLLHPVPDTGKYSVLATIKTVEYICGTGRIATLLLSTHTVFSEWD